MGDMITDEEDVFKRLPGGTLIHRHQKTRQADTHAERVERL